LPRRCRLLRASIPWGIRIEEAIRPASAILGDAGQLHQVVVNLVTNRRSPRHDQLGAAAPRPIADTSHLSVADSGCRMDEATQARIFEPSSPPRTSGKGRDRGAEQCMAS
jgi:signal transduction histidine kinase